MFDRKLKNALVLLNVAVIVFVFFVILTSEQVEKTSTEVLPSEMVIPPVEASIFDTGISSINVEQTEKPIEESSLEAIVVPLEVPTPVTIEEPTPEQTIVPIEEPMPVLSQNDYSAISTELSCLTCGSGVYPNYVAAPLKDLHLYISIQDMGAPQLFDTLIHPFVEGIASCIGMEFDESLYGTEALTYALNSSIDRNIGRVKIGNYPRNIDEISTVFDQIRESRDFANANSVILDFLGKYTRKNPYNPIERWIIACN